MSLWVPYAGDVTFIETELSTCRHVWPCLPERFHSCCPVLEGVDQKKKKKKDRQQRKRKNIGDTCRLLTCSLSEQKHGNLKEAERNNSFGIKGALIKYVYSPQLLRGAEASGSNTFQIDSRSEKAEGGRKAQQVMGSWFILTRKSSVSRRFSLKLKGRSSVQTAKLFSCTF